MSNDISGGGLNFKSQMDNEQLDNAIEQTLKRVQGLVDATVTGGKQMDSTFNVTADSIRDALEQIGDACELHEQAIHNLEQEYGELGRQAGEAFMQGRDAEVAKINETRKQLQGEIAVRKSVLDGLRQQSSALEDLAAKMEKSQQAEEKTANTHVSVRTRLKELREAMIEMEATGQRNTAEYEAMRAEAAKLTDALADATKQASILAHDQKGFQGIISGLGGVSGAFSAAQGAISLFAGQNEDLQRIMVKVQSLMAITVGLQQVQATLDKDSAFRLVTLNGLKEWWAKVVKEATAAEVKNAAATKANAAAQNAQTGAATAGAAANKGLAASFRMVGVAIKSIPGIGWLLAAIGAAISITGHFIRKSREAQKAQEEFNKSLVEGCYKPIGAIEQLAAKWSSLGDDFTAKTAFIQQNRKVFDELGLAINGVTEAENLLNSNKQAFINAQIEKAKAAVYTQQTLEKIKKQVELENEIAQMPDQVREVGGYYYGSYSVMVDNEAKKKKQKELADLKAEIQKGYEDAAAAESEGIRILQEAGIKALNNNYDEGTVGYIEQQISTLQNSIKKMSDPAQIAQAKKQIKDLQESLSSLLGDNKEDVDFKTKLSKVKSEYQQFFKWLNSGDEILIKSAQTEFTGILAQGSTYIDYLKNQRDEIMKVDVANRSKEQTEQLRILNESIAEETKRTVLETFNTELSTQLSNAKNIVEMLKIIEEKRKELANDGTDIDNSKKEMLDNAEEQALDDAATRTQKLLEDYAGLDAKKRQIEEQFAADMLLLDRQLAEAKAKNDIEAQKAVEDAIRNRTEKRDADIKSLTPTDDYEDLLKEFGSFEQRKAQIEAEYEEKRKVARQNNDQQLIQALNIAEKRAISELASGIIENTKLTKLFEDMGQLTLKEIDDVINDINNKNIDFSENLTDEDIKRIVESLENLRREVANKNPFTRLTNAIKEFKDNANDANFRNLTTALSELQGYYDQIVNSIAEIADYTGNAQLAKIAEIAGDIGDVAAAVMQGASSGGWIGAIIGGVIALIPKIYKWASGIKDVQEKNAALLADVKKLSAEYEHMQYVLNKALGDERYTSQVAMIENLHQQIDDLNEAIDNEQSLGDKADAENIAEFRQQIEQLNQQIQELVDDARDALLASDIPSIAAEFGDALINSFAAGEDAAEAWGDAVDKIIKRIVRNMIIQSMVEKSIKPLIEKYTHSWIDDNGNWAGWEAIQNDINLLGADLNFAGESIIAIVNQLKDQFPEWFDAGAATSLTGSVKGVTEETASLVAGQMNAMRINQVEAMSIMRNQLMVLNRIAENTAYNVHLTKLDRIANALDSLNGRAFGQNY